MDRRGYGAGDRRGRGICCEQVWTVVSTPAPPVVALIHLPMDRGWLADQWHCVRVASVTIMFGLVTWDCGLPGTRLGTH
jgi:hypothetical protein